MRRTRRGTTTTAVAVGAALALTSCSGSGTEAAEGSSDGGTLAIATMTATTSMDPADAGGGTIPYYQAVYDTLIKREPDGTYSPMLATAWEYDEARTALTLSLRDDVTFDDGTPLDAEAVKANLERFAEAGGPETPQSQAVESVEAVDPTTVVIRLSAPDPALVNSLSDAFGFIANPAGFGAEEPFATEPDGTGPYELDADETIIGSTWTFVRNEDYWGEVAPFETLTISVFDNENAITNGLRTGQINAAVLQIVDQQVAAEADPNLTLTPQEIDLKLFNLFDRSGAMVPGLGDVRVRQAINHAIDRETLVEQIQQGRGTVTAQLWGVDTPGYVEELDGAYEYDPEQARELLAEAGHADGVAFSLARLPGLVPDALAAALQTDLADVGITLSWVDVDQSSFVQRTFFQREFPGVVMNGGQPALDWATVAGSILPGPVSNPQGTTDPTIEKLSAVVRSGDEQAAEEAAEELNRHIVEQAWFVPLYRMQYMHTTDRSVTVTPQVGLAVPSIYNYQPAS
ncbi:peptide/nickel transport system substrate-binding protein [Blastococcus fimeti]|nr:peptide/nickel transport system substrate-binding protein [Blastococcus fimeti]